MMKSKVLAVAAAVAVGLGAGSAALANSTYGFNSAGTGNVSATASVQVTINVPKVIVLRVGAAGATQDALTFNVSPDIQTAPGVVPTSGSGNDQAATWNAVAPTLNISGGGSLNAYLWHNNAGDASLTCSASALTGAGFALTDILVSNGGSGLSHPGASANCGTTVNSLARNTLHNAAWTYSLNATNMTAANPGSWSTTITYTAATL